MRNIPPLYHWAPTTRRASIRRRGLLPGQPPAMGEISAVDAGRPVVCLALDPASGWALSGGMRSVDDVDEWDLWQVHVADTPVRRVRHWGRVAELRIDRPIHPRGLVLIGQRTRAGARSSTPARQAR